MMADLNFILVDLSMLYVVTTICRSTSGSHQNRQDHGNPGVTAGGEPPRGEWGPRRGSVSRGDNNSRGRGSASGNNAGRRGNNTGRGGGAATGSGAAVR